MCRRLEGEKPRVHGEHAWICCPFLWNSPGFFYCLSAVFMPWIFIQLLLGRSAFDARSKVTTRARERKRESVCRKMPKNKKMFLIFNFSKKKKKNIFYFIFLFYFSFFLKVLCQNRRSMVPRTDPDSDLSSPRVWRLPRTRTLRRWSLIYQRSSRDPGAGLSKNVQILAEKLEETKISSVETNQKKRQKNVCLAAVANSECAAVGGRKTHTMFSCEV